MRRIAREASNPSNSGDEVEAAIPPRHVARCFRADLASLEGTAADHPGILVGDGPGLGTLLPELSELAPRRAIIAAEVSALRPLLLAGVAPQIVVASTERDRALLDDTRADPQIDPDE